MTKRSNFFAVFMSATLPAPSVLANKKELNLYAKNWVRNSHARDIAAILQTNTSLTFVGFRECRGVGDAGAVAIASALNKNRTLKKLNLESTKVGDRGVSAMARALAESTTTCLLRLDLAYCAVGNEGAIALATGLVEPSCPLEVLHLDYCPGIGDEGARALLASLEEASCGLRVLGLKGTSTSAALRAQIEAALALRGRPRRKRMVQQQLQSSSLSVKDSRLQVLTPPSGLPPSSGLPQKTVQRRHRSQTLPPLATDASLTAQQPSRHRPAQPKHSQLS